MGPVVAGGGLTPPMTCGCQGAGECSWGLPRLAIGIQTGLSTNWEGSASGGPRANNFLHLHSEKEPLRPDQRGTSMSGM